MSIPKNNESLYDESGEPIPAYHDDTFVEWLSMETGVFERRSVATAWFLANGERLIPIDGDAFLDLNSGKRYYASRVAAQAQGAHNRP